MLDVSCDQYRLLGTADCALGLHHAKLFWFELGSVEMPVYRLVDVWCRGVYHICYVCLHLHAHVRPGVRFCYQSTCLHGILACLAAVVSGSW